MLCVVVPHQPSATMPHAALAPAIKNWLLVDFLVYDE
jgi:hypothetical protein